MKRLFTTFGLAAMLALPLAGCTEEQQLQNEIEDVQQQEENVIDAKQEGAENINDAKQEAAEDINAEEQQLQKEKQDVVEEKADDVPQ